MHSLLTGSYTCWVELESQIEQIESPTEKGDVFEEVVHFYFQYHSNLYQISELYAPVATREAFPISLLKKLKLENRDHGVDGVYIQEDGTTVCYQAKFRSNRASPSGTELSTFWAEAEYADYRCVVANSDTLPPVSAKKRGHISILGNKFDDLPESFFVALKKSADSSEPIGQEKYEPRPYQQEIIQDVVSGLNEAERGKLIAACGIGKTLIALWVKERLRAQKTLFLAPTLMLIRQTLDSWVSQRTQDFRYICVCSDESVATNILKDYPDIGLDAIDVPVTTDPDLLSEQLSKSETDLVVFSTYQSLDVIRKATEHTDFSFDLTFCDEAHRTAGVKHADLFGLILDDSKIKSQKRVFMTATERLVKSTVKKKVEDAGRVAFSMDDRANYGAAFHRLDFGDAIEQKIISDYRVVLAGVDDAEVKNFVEKNLYVEGTDLDIEVCGAGRLFNRLVLLKSIETLGLKKIITYHSTVEEAQHFCAFLELFLPENTKNTFVGHINGTMSASDRALKIRDFERSDLGILTNVRCLTEGVDIPIIDAVYFSDPKSSVIDIVQAVGRAVRQKYGEPGNISYIIVPVLFDEKATPGESFEEFFDVIQSLREQDQTAAEWIDAINVTAVTGKLKRGRKSSAGVWKIKAILPKTIDVDQFLSFITVQIAEVNKDPVGTTGIGSTLGRRERISTYKRIFTTLGDYTPDKYQESLVDPTLANISNPTIEHTRKQLKINNNNVSHAQRLGVIEIQKNKCFRVTDLGKKYMSGEIDFKSLFKNQMLKYRISTKESPIFPYRIALKVLRQTTSINYYEFLYGLYPIQPGVNEQEHVELTVDTIRKLRAEFPNLGLANEANKAGFLAVLNQEHPADFTYNDVWTDRTTTGNQYRYLRRHLELFDEFILQGQGVSTLSLETNNILRVEEYLENSQPETADQTYGQFLWIKDLNE
jgi:predicted helicase